MNESFHLKNNLRVAQWSEWCDIVQKIALVWVQGSVLIQRYGVNADESRRDPGHDDTLRLEDVEYDDVQRFQSVTVSRG